MKKIYYSWQNIEGQTQEVLRQLQNSEWRPDYVVGLTRGGLVPANLISQYLEVPMQTLKVSLRDDPKTEHNTQMAEDARRGVNILIVDDINDSGATLNWIQENWAVGDCWNENVRVAVLINNTASNYKRIDYSCIDLNKAQEDCWIVFPWEDWWK